MRKLICAVTLLLMTMPVHSQDGYYVWVDENGITNFAEQQPRGSAARYTTATKGFGDHTFAADEPAQQPMRGSRPAPAPETFSAEVDPDRIIAADRAMVAAQIAALKSANCDIGKKNLVQLEMFDKIRIKNDDGTDRLLSPAEKAEKIAVARQTIRDNCTS